tara:strand:+ start:124 stop:1299 length:1176 start_codon:yes stop_codon:yes gene_type:complete
MNYGSRSLADLYGKVAGKEVPPHRHLIDEQQQDLFKTLRSGSRKGQIVPIPGDEKGLKRHEVTDHEKLEISDNDLELFKALDYEDQLKVKKYIETRALKSIIVDTFKGKAGDVDDSLRLLMSGNLSSDQITNVVQLINQDKAVNVDALKLPGNKSWNEIFLHQDVWEAYKDLISVGVNKEQKGPGEVALTFLSPRINLSTKGDIDIDGELYELKLNGGRIADQPAPSRTQMQPILTNYLGEYGLKNPKKETMSIEEFVNRVNQHKEANKANPKVDDNNYRNLAKEVFSALLDEVHAAPFMELFAKDFVSAEDVLNLYKKQSFDWYKNSKKGTDGEWDKLIGINFRKPKSGGIVATTTTGEEFTRSRMAKPQIHILRSGSGTREGYVNYYPQ